ncbi:MAG TPA: hypothetical protein VK507_19185 [Iamia sp.]|nr:hypothetical protein [Iamia sp.]
MAIDIDVPRCAGCGLAIELAGNSWRHVLGEGRDCVLAEGHAHPHALEVAWHRFGNGSESYHVVHEAVTYVLWQHPATEHPQRRPVRWSAWRVSVSTPGLFTEANPSLTVYQLDGPYRSHVLDPRQLLATMPALVAYWLTEKVFPF